MTIHMTDQVDYEWDLFENFTKLTGVSFSNLIM